MAFFTEDFLNARRADLLRSVKRFQYQINGGSWRDGEINSKSVVGNSVMVFVAVPSSGTADTITGVRVYDNNDKLAGQQAVSVKRTSVNAALLRFVFPSIVMMVFTSIYGVVDGFFVSNFAGKTPFAAVNFIMPVLMILGCPGFMFGTGGSALIAKSLGEKQPEKANGIFTMLTVCAEKG